MATISQHSAVGPTPVSQHAGEDDTGRALGGGGVYTEVNQHTGVGTSTPVSGHAGLVGYTEVKQH